MGDSRAGWFWTHIFLPIILPAACAGTWAFFHLSGKISDQAERLAKVEANQASLDKRIENSQNNLEKRLERIEGRLDTLAKATQYQDNANALLARILAEAPADEAMQLQRGAPLLLHSPEQFRAVHGNLRSVQKYGTELEKLINAKKQFRTLEYRPPK